MTITLQKQITFSIIISDINADLIVELLEDFNRTKYAAKISETCIWGEEEVRVTFYCDADQFNNALIGDITNYIEAKVAKSKQQLSLL